ncbi:DUF3822 family protein [uncultured Microscilla sp.]|uniref:DUF3822 family protein n=1 Tax=uncultured Microscilla sp. TaxID=432653 RepID=UPI0026304B58|nr:DUF3822 family protein [uncultured Microscilla sp.]
MDATDKLSIREVSFQDDAFDIQALGNYNLYLSIGQDGLEICVIDTQTNRCLILEHYSFYVNLSHNQLTSHLNWIYDNHLFLKAYRWNEIKIAYRGKAFTLVPKALFEEDEAVKYLKHLTDVTIDQTICYSEIESLNIMNVFLVETELVAWFENIYALSEKMSFVHQTASLLKGLKQQRQLGASGLAHLFLHVESEYLTLSILKDDQLEFCNVFAYKTEQDFLYYVLLVIDELRYFPDKSVVNLTGNIMPDSSIYELLDQYIQKVEITLNQSSVSWVTFNDKFDKDIYQYFDLFSLHL